MWAEETRVTQEAVGHETLASLLGQLGRPADEQASEGKSAEWKLALAAALKAQTPVTNHWLGEALPLGNLHEVSRKVAAWTRGRLAPGARDQSNPPEIGLMNLNPKADPVRLSAPASRLRPPRRRRPSPETRAHRPRAQTHRPPQSPPENQNLSSPERALLPPFRCS
jgi:hypothetical protein